MTSPSRRNLSSGRSTKLFSTVLPVYLFFAGCSATQPETLPASHSRLNARILSEMGKLATGYVLEGDCPNWNEALAIAQSKMGCTAGSKPPSGKCHKELPCDVCQFLAEGAWPPAFIKNFPGEEFHGHNPNIMGFVGGEPQWERTCPIEDKTRAEFKTSLCFEKVLLGLNRVDTLAKTMVHEALHLCKYVGGTGSATTDKRAKHYLYCAVVYGVYSPDAADVVEFCWEAPN